MMKKYTFSCRDALVGSWKSSGFSLVEVLIALLLVSISAAVIIEGYGSALNSNSRASRELIDSELVGLARQQIKLDLAAGQKSGRFLLGSNPVEWKLIDTQSAKKLQGIDSTTGLLDYGAHIIQLQEVEFRIGENARPVKAAILGWRAE